LVELEPEELELDEPGVEPEEPVLPEPDVPEPVLLLPVLLDELLDELLDLDELAFEDVVAAEPGSASATAPAASRLATPIVAVVVVTRPLARWRAATARVTASRFGLFMT
jgi:hypothetical protein